MSEWETSHSHVVQEMFFNEQEHRILLVEEHRGHQNWETTAWLIECDQNLHDHPIRQGDVIDVVLGANKRESMEHARDEWRFDIPEEEWNLDPSWSNVHPSIGPGGVVGHGN